MLEEINELLSNFNLEMEINDGLVSLFNKNKKEKLQMLVANNGNVSEIPLEKLTIGGSTVLVLIDDKMISLKLERVYKKGQTEHPVVISGLCCTTENNKIYYKLYSDREAFASADRIVNGKHTQSLRASIQYSDIDYIENGDHYELPNGLDGSSVSSRIRSIPYYEIVMNYYKKIYPPVLLMEEECEELVRLTENEMLGKNSQEDNEKGVKLNSRLLALKNMYTELFNKEDKTGIEKRDLQIYYDNLLLYNAIEAKTISDEDLNTYIKSLEVAEQEQRIQPSGLIRLKALKAENVRRQEKII